MKIRIKRIYDDPAPADGFRVLVDRLWPRGVRKEDAHIDLWAKDVAPSTELRKRFAHRPERFEEFTQRYERELAERDQAIDAMLAAADGQPITLIYAARDKTCNHALVLKGYVEREWR